MKKEDKTVETEDKFLREFISEDLLPTFKQLAYEIRGLLWFAKKLGYVDPREFDPTALDDKEEKK